MPLGKDGVRKFVFLNAPFSFLLGFKIQPDNLALNA